MSAARRAGTGVLLLAGLTALAGCGDGAAGGSGAPLVGVSVGGQEITIEPTQYCLDGDGQRYDTSPPVLEVSDAQQVKLRVPAEVADVGWSVQVFDEKLAEKIGDVEVGKGKAVFDQITTSDVVPATFYLVVVEDSQSDRCKGLSGAWPVGFIRGATTSTAPTSTAPTSGTPSSTAPSSTAPSSTAPSSTPAG